MRLLLNLRGNGTVRLFHRLGNVGNIEGVAELPLVAVQLPNICHDRRTLLRNRLLPVAQACGDRPDGFEAFVELRACVESNFIGDIIHQQGGRRQLVRRATKVVGPSHEEGWSAFVHLTTDFFFQLIRREGLSAQGIDESGESAQSKFG